MGYRTKFEVEGFQCLRCGYKWVPRIFKGAEEAPTICPRCKSPYWKRPKKPELPREVPAARKERP